MSGFVAGATACPGSRRGLPGGVTVFANARINKSTSNPCIATRVQKRAPPRLCANATYRRTLCTILKISKHMNIDKDYTIIASDVRQRDGIGVEIYRDNKLVVEIFRDDTMKTRTVTIFKETISLELLEECIQIFKGEIPWDFIDNNEL